MHRLAGTAFVNWFYFIASVFLIACACYQIWKTSQQKDKGKTHYQKYKKSELSGAAPVLNYLWRKHYRLGILILTLAASWIVLFADNILSIDNIEPKDELSALLLLVTGAVVFWYTRETYDQKRILEDQKRILRDQKAVQQEQFEFENRPYLRLQWSKSGKEVLQIVNDGKGIARDVCFELTKFEDGTLFAPLRRPIIAPGQYSTITTHELQEAGKKAEVNGYAEYIYNIKREANKLLKKGEFKELHVTYLDLQDRAYDVYFTPDERYNDRFSIKSQEKRK